MKNKIERFEDLIAWQKARQLTREIYRITRAGRFARDFGLKNQIQRASVSIMSNLAEGFERGRPTEFHQYISIAKGSCAEVRWQLYVAWDAEYLERDEFVGVMNKAREVGRIIGGLRRAIERKKKENIDN